MLDFSGNTLYNVLTNSEIKRKKEIIMSQSSLDMYKELYNDQADRSAELAGELGSMAFMAGELLLKLQADRLDTVTGRKAIEEMENILREYYQGTGKESPFARPWAKLAFEEGIEETV
tara:strand:- start:688 stop:1041 length:354 start_codon:yes stop_codon:yes gene_type:complete